MSSKYKTPRVAVIPAAGRGTRFLPSTKATPKEMHPLLNKPLLHHCLEELAIAGVDRVIVVNHRNKKSIENYFEDHNSLKELLIQDKKRGLVKELENIENLPKVSFVYQDQQLGLAHAISCAQDQVGEEDFYVLLPDEIFIPSTAKENPCVELRESFAKTGLSAVSLLEVPRNLVSQYGVVKINNKGNIEDVVEKPAIEKAPSNLILPGRYILKNSIFNAIKKTLPKKGEVLFTDALLIHGKEAGGLQGVVTKCPRFDGGSVLGFLQANVYAATTDPVIGKDFLSWLKSEVEKH